MLHHIGIYVFMFSFVWKIHVCVLHTGIYVRTVAKFPNNHMTFMLIYFFILQVKELRKNKAKQLGHCYSPGECQRPAK